MEVLFNQDIKSVDDLSLINNLTLNLRIMRKSLSRVNFTWKCVGFTPRIMTLQLRFEEPLSISVESKDILVIEVRDRDMFFSKRGVVIASKYKIQ